MAAAPVKKACDACHRRKVKCSGDQPCNNCAQTNLQCTYLAIPQKKGPKGSRGKVISGIRSTQQDTNPPTTSASAVPSFEKEPSFDFSSPPKSPPNAQNISLLSRQTIENCIDFYFSNMSTTAWILHCGALKHAIASRLMTDPELYCLTGSICAFVMVQPGMNLAVAPGSYYEGEPPENRYGYANMILNDIIRTRKSINYVESPTLASVQTAFFLFSCYFTLEEQNVCWFYLREAATLAHLMGLHEESSYLLNDPVDSRYRRRMYWLLLVTERAYAMERHRPLTLHPTIELPTTHDQQEEEMISGFSYLISLFSCIDDEFMALWNKVKTDCSATWLSRLQQQLKDALPNELETTESQIADVRVTMNWLRIMVWQLSITNGYLSSSSNDSSMTFKYPIEVARDLVRELQDLSLDAMEVHGIGLIEKLFDIACTLTDVIACVPFDVSTNETPFDTLNKLLNLISRLRGGASRYLPLLLTKVSETLPSIAQPAPVNLNPSQLSITQGYAGATDNLPTPAPAQYSSLGSFGPEGFTFGSQYALNQNQEQAPQHDRSPAGLMFDGYSPSVVGTKATSNLTPGTLGTPPAGYLGFVGQINPPQSLHPTPRSVPVATEPSTQHDGYAG
ncbi:C6 zinc finger protein [Cladophialophora carrionii]|uniref:C6 zinc finger protein n=1 Tax=Cladophialophora carrionii TaxID=86049 RepID=A0A1C1CB47_9EURO|nr:C6 zinc finger protein [Cladophialophora carrionii]